MVMGVRVVVVVDVVVVVLDVLVLDVVLVVHSPLSRFCFCVFAAVVAARGGKRATVSSGVSAVSGGRAQRRRPLHAPEKRRKHASSRFARCSVCPAPLLPPCCCCLCSMLQAASCMLQVLLVLLLFLRWNWDRKLACTAAPSAAARQLAPTVASSTENRLSTDWLVVIDCMALVAGTNER